MTTTDQVAGEAEARRNLADALEVTATYSGGTATDLAVLTRANLPMILAALRAQPERGAEEMREPSPGLLMSMALRYDHGLGMPGYYDFQESVFGEPGTGTGAHTRRLESTLSTMRQLWEEVTGNGFYKPAAEADYAARLANLRALPLHPAKDDD